MSSERLLIDTSYVAALLNKRDQFHDQAKAAMPLFRVASEILITEAVLIEIGNILARINRLGAVGFIRSCYQTPNLNVVKTDESLIRRALSLYADRND